MSPDASFLIIAIPIGFLLIFLFWVIGTSNRFARLKLLMRESWSNVDIALKRRYDLIPNLVETVKGYANHEREVLERLVEARNRAAASHGAVDAQAADESEFVRALNTVLVRVEGYPELRSNKNFLELQRELINTEDRIAAARRFYNANVRDYNILRESFPSSLLAGNHPPASFFEVESLAVREPVPVRLSSDR